MKNDRRFKVFMAKAERSLISFIVVDQKKHQWLTGLAICLMLIAAAFLQEFLLESSYQPPDLFFVPLAIAAILFGYAGICFVLPAVIVRHLVLYGYSLPSLIPFTNEIFIIFKWSLIIIITAFAMKKYREAYFYEQRFKRDLELARVLQRTLVPKPFNLGRIRVTGYIKQSMQIGGDFYYFRPFKRKYAMFAIGDVMGKGITAAIAMAVIMGIFYEWGVKSILPSSMLHKINRRIIRLWGESHLFSTVFYGILNENTGEFIHASAGHQSAILIGKTGEGKIITGDGLPVGMYTDMKWTNYHMMLEPGDKIILFTDGICEARNSKNEMYSVERLMSVVEKYRASEPEQIRNKIIDDLQKFTKQPHSVGDDKAIVIIELIEEQMQ